MLASPIFKPTSTWFLGLMLLPCLAGFAPAVELAVLTEENWEEFAPAGKEADAIYGDYVLRNDRIVAVIARDIDGRNANMTVRNVGGAVIDLTRREKQSDQLSAYYPVVDRRLRLVQVDPGGGHAAISADRLREIGHLRGETVSLRLQAEAAEAKPAVQVVYTLADDDEAIVVETIYTNPHSQPLEVQVEDAMRVDGEFEMGVDKRGMLFWAYDRHWRQGYGVQSLENQIHPDETSLERRRPILRYDAHGGTIELQPGEEHAVVLKRRIFPAADLIGVKAIAGKLHNADLGHVAIAVKDDAGAVRGATIEVTEPAGYGSGRADDNGRWSGELPKGECSVVVKAQGRPERTVDLEVGGPPEEIEVQLEQPGYVVAAVTDGEGREIPCKVSFHGRDGTPDPDFGPDSAIHGVRNLQYTADGRFRIEIAPGQYDVVISHGPEYDAAFRQIELERGEEAKIEAELVRSVDTTGWLSAEFHSHSSPSGDNTSSQRGRVLNLLAEHLEFIPCTEHNRVDTYVSHLEHFDALDRVATCSGMELTGQPLPINHQNAFPLAHKPRTQDGGGPVTDPDPIVQIERLAMWDSGSDKLVQTNHPHIPQIVGDRDYDGEPDEGFEKMFGYMDVIEVHPPAGIFTPPTSLPPSDRDRGNPIFHWMQLLNIGYRVPGVVNTDAHWNFHGSGWLRNYIQSKTDDPSQAEIMDLVHASEQGRMVMTNGPFLEVTATAGTNGDGGNHAGVGGDLAARDGYVQLHIRVQCPNWHDVNRVQVFVSGRPSEEHNYRRATHRDLFGSGVVKFDQTVQVRLDGDAHVIVATAGEDLTLGRVMGGPHADDMPVAVTNPIFVDVDGGGFTPSGDMLGAPLRLPEGHEPSHGHDGPRLPSASSAGDPKDGFRSIFNGMDLTGWTGAVDDYEVRDGAIVCKPGRGGVLFTEEEYGDFIVRLEFKLPPGGNNGLAIRYPGEGSASHDGMCELQVLDNTAEKYADLDPRQYHGSAYGMVAAKRGHLRKVGQWNEQEVTVRGSRIKVELNGTVILDADLAEVSDFMNDYSHPGKDRRRGHFGFAGHGDPVMFRNLSIKRLDTDAASGSDE